MAVCIEVPAGKGVSVEGPAAVRVISDAGIRISVADSPLHAGPQDPEQRVRLPTVNSPRLAVPDGKTIILTGPARIIVKSDRRGIILIDGMPVVPQPQFLGLDALPQEKKNVG